MRGFLLHIRSATVCALLVTGNFATASSSTVLLPAHSGIWYDPARSGEGYVVEVVSSTLVTLTWFTYDEAGKQRWLFGVGSVIDDEDGVSVRFPELLHTSGGEFGENFDPSQVVKQVVGSGTLTFSECNQGTFEYHAYNERATVEITRIANTMGVACAPVHGRPDELVQAYAGESGTWYDRAHSGEGFQLQWNVRGEALLTWYSYDADGNQYWMTGVGVRSGDSVTFPSLIATKGARFGSGFDPSDVSRLRWGSLTLELNCGSGAARYASALPGFGSGRQELSRLTGLSGIPCPWVPAKLAELYSIDVVEVPTALHSHGLPRSVQVFSMADDGTLIGAEADGGRFQLLRLVPGASEWEALTERRLAAFPFEISQNGQVILINEYATLEGPASTLRWSTERGLQPISDPHFEQSHAYAGSPSLSHIVGTGRAIFDPLQYPWIWSSETGQQPLPLSNDIALAYPLAVSEGGNVVVGYSVESAEGGAPLQVGVTWLDGKDPQFLFDQTGSRLGIAAACSHECEFVFGHGQADPQEDHPFRHQPWLRDPSGATQYLGHMEGALLDTDFSPYGPRETTSDGSMLIGGYITAGPSGAVREEAFGWTRFTGLEALRNVTPQVAGLTADWNQVRAMDVSSDGSRILLTGSESEGGASPRIFRALIVVLTNVRGH